MDVQFMEMIAQQRTPFWLDLAMTLFTTAGLFAFVASGLLLWSRQHRLGRSIVTAQALALVGTLVFYYLANRPRPDIDHLILMAPALPSFPSGHVAITTATLSVWWLGMGWTRRTAMWFVLALLIALSRVYLGHHYPTDLLGGALLGASVGAGVYGVIANPRLPLRQRLSWLLWPQIGLALLVTMMAYLNLLPRTLLQWQGADKVLHFVLFGLITFWLNLWWRDRRIELGAIAMPLAILLPFSLAFSEELMQAWSPIRTFDLLDLAADLCGMIFCWWASLHVLEQSVLWVRQRD